MLPEKNLVHVCEVHSQTNLIESKLAESLQNFLTEGGFDFRMMVDASNPKCLRFNLPLEIVTLPNVLKIKGGIEKLITDAKISWPGLGVVNPDLSSPIPRPQKFEAGQWATCNYAQPLPGNEIGPALVKGKTYPVKEVIIDEAGNQHLDVGLKSTVAYVSSFETKEWLDRGKEIHWCHPSRFTLGEEPSE